MISSSRVNSLPSNGVINFFNSRSKFEETFGEGTKFDLDYGKLFIIGLCIYIAITVSGCHTVGMG